MNLKKILFGKYEYHKKSSDDKIDMRINVQFGILPIVAIVIVIALMIWLF